jgi:prepilin-type N-terminal cleavage/methylation domain-containing protein
MKVRSRRGFTLIELLFVVGLIGVLTAIAAPALTRTRMAANESSAIASLRVVHSGQQAFWASCGNGNYALSLQDLGIAPPGSLSGFVSTDISGPAPVVKSGYEFDLASDNLAPTAGNGCHGRPLGATYHVTADPLPSRGRRYFGSNGGGAVFQSTATLFTDMPDSGSPPAPAIPIQQ